MYLLISNNVDIYEGNVVEQGSCFTCLLQCFSLKHFDNRRTIDEQGLCFTFIFAPSYIIQ